MIVGDMSSIDEARHRATFEASLDRLRNNPPTITEERAAAAYVRPEADDQKPKRPGEVRYIEPFRPKIRGSVPRLQATFEEEAQRMRDDPPVAEMDGKEWVPGQFVEEPEIFAVPPWLALLFEKYSGKAAGTRSAPWALRLMVGAFLHLGISERDCLWKGMSFETNDVESWLHPSGWKNRLRDWEKLPAALHEVNREGKFYFAGVGMAQMLFASVIPLVRTDQIVEFVVRCPKSSAWGDRINWPLLCEYGSSSYKKYRAYLSAVALMGKSARNGHPITAKIGAPQYHDDGRVKRRRGGKIIRSATETIENPARRFVPRITDRDLAAMCGLDPECRFRRRDAIEIFRGLHTDGAIDLLADGSCYQICGRR